MSEKRKNKWSQFGHEKNARKEAARRGNKPREDSSVACSGGLDLEKDSIVMLVGRFKPSPVDARSQPPSFPDAEEVPSPTTREFLMEMNYGFHEGRTVQKEMGKHLSRSSTLRTGDFYFDLRSDKNCTELLTRLASLLCPHYPDAPAALALGNIKRLLGETSAAAPCLVALGPQAYLELPPAKENSVQLNIVIPEGIWRRIDSANTPSAPGTPRH